MNPASDTELSLSWVTFSEEETQDVCQRRTFECSNEATHVVRYATNCCGVARQPLCWTCVEDLTEWGWIVACYRCGEDKTIVSIQRIGR